MESVTMLLKTIKVIDLWLKEWMELQSRDGLQQGHGSIPWNGPCMPMGAAGWGVLITSLFSYPASLCSLHTSVVGCLFMKESVLI